jgi:hypothetical protein
VALALARLCFSWVWPPPLPHAGASARAGFASLCCMWCLSVAA